MEDLSGLAKFDELCLSPICLFGMLCNVFEKCFEGFQEMLGRKVLGRFLGGLSLFLRGHLGIFRHLEGLAYFWEASGRFLGGFWYVVLADVLDVLATKSLPKTA